MKRGFYESYKQEKENEERKIIVRNVGIGTAVVDFFKSLITAVFYLIVAGLSSVGLTVLINQSLRDMFVKLVIQTVMGNGWR